MNIFFIHDNLLFAMDAEIHRSNLELVFDGFEYLLESRIPSYFVIDGLM
jgi:hypothetical protein